MRLLCILVARKGRAVWMGRQGLAGIMAHAKEPLESSRDEG